MENLSRCVIYSNLELYDEIFSCQKLSKKYFSVGAVTTSLHSLVLDCHNMEVYRERIVFRNHDSELMINLLYVNGPLYELPLYCLLREIVYGCDRTASSVNVSHYASHSVISHYSDMELLNELTRRSKPKTKKRKKKSNVINLDDYVSKIVENKRDVA